MRKLFSKGYFYELQYDNGSGLLANVRTPDECRTIAEHYFRNNFSEDELVFEYTIYIGHFRIINLKKSIYIYRDEYPEYMHQCKNCKYYIENKCTKKIPKKYQGPDSTRPCFDDYSEEYIYWRKI